MPGYDARINQLPTVDYFDQNELNSEDIRSRGFARDYGIMLILSGKERKNERRKPRVVFRCSLISIIPYRQCGSVKT